MSVVDRHAVVRTGLRGAFPSWALRQKGASDAEIVEALGVTELFVGFERFLARSGSATPCPRIGRNAHRIEGKDELLKVLAETLDAMVGKALE